MTTVVFVDLETTGVSRTSEAIQIGAVCGHRTFSVYMKPEGNIDWQSSDITGLQVLSGMLCKNRQPVAVSPRREAWQSFIAFLQQCGSNVILAAHDGDNLDFPVMVRETRRLSLLSELQAAARGGGADTAPLFPGRPGLKTLAGNYGIDTSGLHDAKRDAEILQEVCQRQRVTAEQLKPHAKPLV